MHEETTNIYRGSRFRRVPQRQPPPHLSNSTYDIFKDFLKFLPKGQEHPTSVLSLLESIVSGIYALPDFGARLQEKSNLASVAYSNWVNIGRQEAEDLQSAESYYKGIWRDIDLTIRIGYVPFEEVAAATKGLEEILEGQILHEVRTELAKTEGVVKIYKYLESQPSLHVPIISRLEFARKGKEIVNELIEDAIYNAYKMKDYQAVQDYFLFMKISYQSLEPELKFFHISSAYRLAIQTVPTSNRQRGITLGLIKNTTEEYINFLQQHHSVANSFTEEMQEDVKAGEVFVNRLRGNYPKDYVKEVADALNGLAKYVPSLQNQGITGKVLGLLRIIR